MSFDVNIYSYNHFQMLYYWYIFLEIESEGSRKQMLIIQIWTLVIESDAGIFIDNLTVISYFD